MTTGEEGSSPFSISTVGAVVVAAPVVVGTGDSNSKAS